MNDSLKTYLYVAVELGFEGASFVDDGDLYLCGDACRLIYEESPSDVKDATVEGGYYV